MTEALPDLLDHGLILLFCGTAASEVSARERAYYANPSNRFWAALHKTGITPRRLASEAYRELLRHRIGLTDLAKARAGSDRHLRPGDFQPARLHGIIARCQPQIVAFTSKRAWREFMGASASRPVDYGWQPGAGATRFFVLPSPSGAARGHWDWAPWQALAEEYRRLLRGS